MAMVQIKCSGRSEEKCFGENCGIISVEELGCSKAQVKYFRLCSATAFDSV